MEPNDLAPELAPKIPMEHRASTMVPVPAFCQRPGPYWVDMMHTSP